MEEPEDYFLSRVQLPSAIHHPHKRLQHLAGRLLLLELFPDFPIALIEIADSKKPFLPDEAFHFSISHAGNYASAIVSRENRVGIDIETISPKVKRLQHKFLTPDEQALILENEMMDHAMGFDASFTLAWSVKEAMFKWYSLGGVDFKAHLRIHQMRYHNHHFEADCSFLKNTVQPLLVNGLLFEGNALTWVLS